jgi:hypothetical protein
MSDTPDTIIRKVISFGEWVKKTKNSWKKYAALFRTAYFFIYSLLFICFQLTNF